MALTPGARLGPYEITAQIGVGGMGEVYRATDTNLKRAVAIKVLPGRLAADADRLARFQREAEVLASLNHPNIASIYGLERSADVTALVMELVEGPTLADRIARGAIPIDEALPIAKQIADALDAAHETGIIHRDLKPANIKVRSDGAVKVLDFGLAKAMEPAGTEEANASMSPTFTSPAAMTEAGMILGTAAYMSPEQARGRAVDTRSDIWAFGCVLYEMLTGRRAFHGESVTDLLAAVVGAEPDLSVVPPALRPLIQRCLAKDVRRRLRDIGDAMALVEVCADHSPTSSGAAARAWSRYWWIPWAGLVTATAAAAGVALVHFRERTAPPRPSRLQMALPDGMTSSTFAVSPDGRSLLLLVQREGATRLALRSFETGELRELPGTAQAGRGFWSPDGRFIAFAARGTLNKLAAAGGAPEVLVATGAGGVTGCWGKGEIIFGNQHGGFSRVAESGGEPSVLTTVDQTRGEIHHESASCLPDGRFLYYRHLQERGASGIYVGVTTLPADRQRLTPLLVADDGPLFVRGSDAAGDRLLFMQDKKLFAQRFRPDALELVGDPVPVADGVMSGIGSVNFAATAGSLLVYRRAGDINRQLTWLDRQGNVTGTVGDPNPALRGLRIAPDGERAAVDQFPPGERTNNDDIWIVPFSAGPTTRMTSDLATDITPVWAADGRRVAFTSFRSGRWAVYQQAVGSVTAEPLSLPAAISPTPGRLSDWSRDGRFIVMTIGTPQTRGDLWVLPVTPGQPAPQTVSPLVQTTFNEDGASFSPDGRWIAYLSDESGRNEVYVRSFVVSADGTRSSPESGKRLVSNGARGAVRWRRDGRELAYLAADGRMMSIEVSTAAGLTVAAPRPLFSLPPEYLRNQPGAGLMDMTPDGMRFLVAMPPKEAPRTDLEVILNWKEE